MRIGRGPKGDHFQKAHSERKGVVGSTGLRMAGASMRELRSLGQSCRFPLLPFLGKIRAALGFAVAVINSSGSRWWPVVCSNIGAAGASWKSGRVTIVGSAGAKLAAAGPDTPPGSDSADTSFGPRVSMRTDGPAGASLPSVHSSKSEPMDT
jgi:hypothetical protein